MRVFLAFAWRGVVIGERQADWDWFVNIAAACRSFLLPLWEKVAIGGLWPPFF
jgi:hypothetical protein